MIKLIDLLENKIIVTQQKIQQYIKDGSKGSLNLSSTPITSLPQCLTVRNHLYLKNTPLSKKYSVEQIKQMVPGVKGDIYMT